MFPVILAAVQAATPNAWGKALGHLHPVLVHFPVALLIVGAALELRAFHRRRPQSPETLACVAIGALGAVAASASGWILDAVEPAAASVDLHRWFGVATASLAVLTLILGLIARNPARERLRRPYATLAFLTAAAVALTGHFGGSLTHGPDFITGPWRDLLRPPAPPSTATIDLTAIRIPQDGQVLFARDVKPILDAACVSCHGEAKSKGRLRVDSRDALLMGGKHGPALVPGDPDASPIILRLDDPDPDVRMPPPPDHPALPDPCVWILRAWVEAGAPWAP